MPKIRTLELIFDFELQPYEIPAFRGAIIDLVGRDHVAFHNHKGESGYFYHYPRIQYKVNRQYAAIFCLEDGIEELYDLFSKKNNHILFSGKRHKLSIRHISIANPLVQTWDRIFHYRIFSWLPLSQRNFKTYQEKESEVERLQMLEAVLKGNMLTFAKGINWQVERELSCKITRVIREKKIKHKAINMKAFDLEFSTNVYLPNQVGLGKGVSTGFGVVRHKRKTDKKPTNEDKLH